MVLLVPQLFLQLVHFQLVKYSLVLVLPPNGCNDCSCNNSCIYASLTPDINGVVAENLNLLPVGDRLFRLTDSSTDNLQDTISVRETDPLIIETKSGRISLQDHKNQNEKMLKIRT